MKKADEVIDLGFGHRVEVFRHHDCKSPNEINYTCTHYSVDFNTDRKQLFAIRLDRIDAQLEDLQNRAFLLRTKIRIKNIRSQIQALKQFAD